MYRVVLAFSLCLAPMLAHAQEFLPDNPDTQSSDQEPNGLERYAIAVIPIGSPVGEWMAMVKGRDGQIDFTLAAFAAASDGGGLQYVTLSDLKALSAYHQSSLSEQQQRMDRLYAASMEAIDKLEKQLKEVSEDYDLLAARYNRLAAVSGSSAVDSAPRHDNTQLIQAIMLQRLLTPRPQPIQLQPYLLSSPQLGSRTNPVNVRVCDPSRGICP